MHNQQHGLGKLLEDDRLRGNLGKSLPNFSHSTPFSKFSLHLHYINPVDQGHRVQRYLFNAKLTAATL